MVTPFLLSLVAFISTFAGGLFALRLRSRLEFMLAFTAGVLLGVVAFDIVPEIVALASRRTLDIKDAMVALIAGFLFFHALEKFLLVHHSHEAKYVAHRHPQVGVLSGLALIAHSFMDGMAIALGFQVSEAAGISVAIAVISHDFCDGLNTVNVMLASENSAQSSKAMLLADAAAPILGVASASILNVSADLLALYLGFFAGFLLYIGAADILPEAHSQASPGTAVALISLTTSGAAFVYVVRHLAR